MIRSGGAPPAPAPTATPIIDVGVLLRLCPAYTVQQCQTFTSWQPTTSVCQEKRRVACLDLLKGEATKMTGDKRPMYAAGNDADDLRESTRTDLASKNGLYGAYDVGNVRVMNSASALYSAESTPLLLDLGAQAAAAARRASAARFRKDTILFLPGLASPPPQKASVFPAFASIPTPIGLFSTAIDTGDRILSCADYVRKRTWDYTGFEMAAAGCGGDKECVYQAAYAPSAGALAPRIAYRALLQRDGRTAPDQLPLEARGLPKNPYFAGTVESVDLSLRSVDQALLTVRVHQARGDAGDWVEITTSLSDKRARLVAIKAILTAEKGDHYVIGAPGDARPNPAGVETFASEWDFHARMHDRLRPLNLSPDEQREYAKRRDRAVEMGHAYWGARASLGACQPPVAGGASIDPRDAVWQFTDPDPWERGAAHGGAEQVLPASDMELARFAATRGEGLVARVASTLQTARAGSVGTSFVGAQVPGQTQLPAGGGVVRAPVIMRTTSLGSSQSQWTNPQVAYTCQAQAEQAIAVAADDLTDALLLEYDRLQRRVPSCLDTDPASPTSRVCDWSLDVFSDRIASKLTAERAASYDACLTTTSNDFNPAKFEPLYELDAAGNPGQLRYGTLESATRNVSTFDDYMVQRRKTRLAEVNAVPAYDRTLSRWDGNGPPPPRGVRQHSSETLGDPDSFSAGYNFDLDWKVTPTAYTPLSHRVCKLDGQATAKFHAGVTVPSSVRAVASVVDAVARLSGVSGLAKSADQMTVTELLDALENVAYSDTKLALVGGTTSFQSNLVLVGENVFSPIDEKGTSHAEFDITSTPRKLSSTKLEKTVMVGPFPLTFAAWGEVEYGADLSGHLGTVPPDASCTEDSFPFDASLVLKPYVAVSGVGSVAFGVSGFEAGLRGRVEVLRIAIPISSQVAIGLDNDSTSIGFRTRGDLLLSELGGSFSVFAEVAFWDYEKEVFSWNGLHQEVPLWNVDKKIHLAALQEGGPR